MKELSGVVEYFGEALKFDIEFNEDCWYFYTSGDFEDDLRELEEFIDRYGDVYYESLEDFKKGNQKSITEFFEG